MVDWGSWRIERSSLTVSSFRSRASRSLLLVGSARAVIWPKMAVGVIGSIRSSGLKGTRNRPKSQVLFDGLGAGIFLPMMWRPLKIGLVFLVTACARQQ